MVCPGAQALTRSHGPGCLAGLGLQYDAEYNESQAYGRRPQPNLAGPSDSATSLSLLTTRETTGEHGWRFIDTARI